MNEIFLRSQMLLSKEAIDKLNSSKVCIFGVGGVGSFACEALARIGIGNIILVDNDIVSKSNINRQLVALHSTIGVNKTIVMKARILDINPDCNVQCENIFVTHDSNIDFISDCDYIVDAIDTVSAKVYICKKANEKNIPVISAMGCGNRLSPFGFEVCDIFKTSYDPLCKAMRKQLRDNGITKLKVVYNKTPAITPYEPECIEGKTLNSKRKTPGSLPYVPSVCGLIIAYEVTSQLIND